MLGLLALITGSIVAKVQETIIDTQSIEYAKQIGSPVYTDAYGHTQYLTGDHPKAKGPIVREDRAEDGHRVGLNKFGQVVRDYTEELADEKIAELRRRPKAGKTVVSLDDGIAHWSFDRQRSAMLREEKLPKYYGPLYGAKYKDIQTGEIYVQRWLVYVRDERGLSKGTSFYMNKQCLLVRPSDSELEKTHDPYEIEEMNIFISFFNDLQKKGGYINFVDPGCKSDDKYVSIYGNPIYCNEFALGMKNYHERIDLIPRKHKAQIVEQDPRTISHVFKMQRVYEDGSLSNEKKSFRLFDDLQIGDKITMGDNQVWVVIDRR